MPAYVHLPHPMVALSPPKKESLDQAPFPPQEHIAFRFLLPKLTHISSDAQTCYFCVQFLFALDCNCTVILPLFLKSLGSGVFRVCFSACCLLVSYPGSPWGATVQPLRLAHIFFLISTSVPWNRAVWDPIQSKQCQIILKNRGWWDPRSRPGGLIQDVLQTVRGSVGRGAATAFTKH